MSFKRDLQRVRHSLGRKVVRGDPLRNDNCIRRGGERMRVKTEIENQLLWRTRDAAKVGIRRNEVRIVDPDRGLHRGRFVSVDLGGDRWFGRGVHLRARGVMCDQQRYGASPRSRRLALS